MWYAPSHHSRPHTQNWSFFMCFNSQFSWSHRFHSLFLSLFKRKLFNRLHCGFIRSFLFFVHISIITSLVFGFVRISRIHRRTGSCNKTALDSTDYVCMRSGFRSSLKKVHAKKSDKILTTTMKMEWKEIQRCDIKSLRRIQMMKFAAGFVVHLWFYTETVSTQFSELYTLCIEHTSDSYNDGRMHEALIFIEMWKE